MTKLKRARKSLRRNKRLEWEEAPEVKSRVDRLVTALELGWVTKEGVVCLRSSNSRARATARIWGLPRVWQLALNEEPMYVIEVISERFEKLSAGEKDKVLLHELAHIPRTFSGALLPHTRRGRGSFYSKLKGMVKDYERRGV